MVLFTLHEKQSKPKDFYIFFSWFKPLKSSFSVVFRCKIKEAKIYRQEHFLYFPLFPSFLELFRSEFNRNYSIYNMNLAKSPHKGPIIHFFKYI